MTAASTHRSINVPSNGQAHLPVLARSTGEPRFALPETDVQPENNPYEAKRDQLRGELERSISEIGGMRVKWLKVHSFMLAELDTAIGECVKEGVPQKERERKFEVLLDLAQGLDIGNTRANTLYVTACRNKVLTACSALDAEAAAKKPTAEQQELETLVRERLGKHQYLHALRDVLIQKEYHRRLKVPLVIEKHLVRAEKYGEEARQEAEQGRFSKSRASAKKIGTAVQRAVHAAKFGLYRAAGLRPHDAVLVGVIFHALQEDTLTAVDTIRQEKAKK